MTDTSKRPPLCLALKAADKSLTSDLATPEARAIKAMRDWLIRQGRIKDIDQDNIIYRMLTAEVERAERGES